MVPVNGMKLQTNETSLELLTKKGIYPGNQTGFANKTATIYTD